MKTEIINIWPTGDAPGASDSQVQPQIIDLAEEYQPHDRAASGVRCPEIAFWHPEESNGTTLLVAPGGAFEQIMIDKEGSALAMFFTNMGYTLAVMTYRFPQDGHHEGADAPLADAQRAVRILRHRASQGLNGKRVVMMGFSAGGYVAGSVGTRFAEKCYPVQDIADSLSARPDALVLIYPVISMREGLAHPDSRQRLLGEHPTQKEIDNWSLETRVTEETPQTLLIHAVNDRSVPINNSMVMFSALREKKVASELHFYEQGGHGFGIRNVADLPLASWPMLVNEWLRARKW
ncbi:alpha/beta hydrolase [Erwinia psidii]|uniref:Alpha/beta hydrolase n=1 Tax=Erwinia psidii TaxID=69224 RepID=A0A3N6S271_9GAMM|nr:alpha/beta hydrolase [Erwinia psidii]MCX8958356.1 alpha/beta hydrolase [Erwinia psidii]MCX8961131.1 alpha/beta hydrolase [Erwinia psidii]MCX8965440.1 alpha/beta hydrolase [Erwinia psidii]RQM38927.1 alpha/beta hydrolase [Erwinia psidii]